MKSGGKNPRIKENRFWKQKGPHKVTVGESLTEELDIFVKAAKSSIWSQAKGRRKTLEIRQIYIEQISRALGVARGRENGVEGN